MFQYFFSEYKQEIYRGSLKALKSLPATGWTLALISIICVGGSVVTLWLNNGNIYAASGVWFLFAAVSMVIFYLWTNRHLDKTRNERMMQYKSEKLCPLIKLLKDDRFSFYSEQKVDWLISCCESELNAGTNPLKGVPDSFFRWVFPTITLFLGTLIDSLSPTGAAEISATVFLVWIIAFMVKIPLGSFVDYLACPDREALLFLKSELQYVRLLLSDTTAYENAEAGPTGTNDTM